MKTEKNGGNFGNCLAMQPGTNQKLQLGSSAQVEFRNFPTILLFSSASNLDIEAWKARLVPLALTFPHARRVVVFPPRSRRRRVALFRLIWTIPGRPFISSPAFRIRVAKRARKRQRKLNRLHYERRAFSPVRSALGTTGINATAAFSVMSFANSWRAVTDIFAICVVAHTLINRQTNLGITRQHKSCFFLKGVFFIFRRIGWRSRTWKSWGSGFRWKYGIF